MGSKLGSGRYFKFLMYLVVVVLVNVAGITLFFRIDLTANGIYSISKASQTAVSTLSEPLTINVFFTQNLPAPHNNTERYLRDLLEEYAIYGNRYFNYRFYDVSPDEGDISEEARGNQALASNYGITPVQIQVVEEDEVKFQKAFMGLAIIHGDLIERIPAITTTDGLEYRLTTAIRKLNNKISALLRLNEKIQVKLVYSSSLKVVAPFMRLNDLPQLPGQVENMVERLAEQNYGKMAYEHLDPDRDSDAEAFIKKHKIMQLRWPELSGGKIPSGEGAIGLVMEHGERAVVIPLLSVMRIPLIGKHYELVDVDDLENIMNESVESLIDINENMGYLTSHGAHELVGGAPMDLLAGRQQEGLSHFHNLLSQNYTVDRVDVKKDARIPDHLNCLVVARPTEPFSDYELFQIDQFLMRGKNLALFVDAFNEVMPNQGQAMQFNRGPSYVPIRTGLEKLLKHYGITIKHSYVLDENCYKQEIPQQFGGGDRKIYFAPIIQNERINRDLPFMQNIKGLVAMKISPLVLNTDDLQKKGITAQKVFSSSDQSWEMKGRIDLNPMFLRPPRSTDEMRSYPLAYVLEGEFLSYFAGKEIPEKTVDDDDEDEEGPSEQGKGNQQGKSDPDLSKIQGEDEFVSKGKTAKIFIMAASEMLKNNVLDEQGRTPNAMFVLNTIDFLNNREDIALMRSKEQRFNPLADTSVAAKTIIKSFNIAGLPMLVVLFGILFWIRRRVRKRQIEAMFQPAK